MKYSKDWLKKEIAENKKIEYLFFYGHAPYEDDTLGKRCMSQWWQARFCDNLYTYKTAEHYMMVKKAELFNDLKIIDQIVKCDSPKEAKALGRLVKNFDSVIWDSNKYKIVKQGNVLKFSQNQELKNFLLETGNKVIVEASPRDVIWGIGMGETNPKSLNPNTWRGKNLLGFALMEVRDEINRI
ncbi:MAG: NADAR family protein [Bacteroidota bacterium]|nr:NADAR family protein [Bacteroidota bacterium]